MTDRPDFAGQKLIRHVNERRVLTLLRHAGPISRAEIARRIGVTRSTVTSVVDELVGRGMLRDTPEASPPAEARIGRPGTGVALDGRGSFYLGVEIGVGVMRAALVNLAVATVGTQTVPIGADWPVDRVLAQAARITQGFTADPGVTGRLRGVGITVPGLVATEGAVVHLPILGWRDVNLIARARAHIALPLVVENNANAAAFGEVYADSSAPADVVLYLKIGTGCGGAVILDGRLLRGAGGSATEFGHIRVADAGEVCSCGRRGCLETLVNVAAMRRGLPDGADGRPDVDVPRLLAAAATTGHPAAQAVVDAMRRALARGLIDLANVFDPSRIVLGGIARPVLALLAGDLQADVADGIVPGLRPPAVILSRHGEAECAVGAAMVMHHQDTDVSDLQFVSLMSGVPKTPASDLAVARGARAELRQL